MVLSAVAVAVIALVLIGTSRQAGSVDGNGAGRYQIVIGTYDLKSQAGAGDKPADAIAHGAFKIDTVTGQTWLYREEVSFKGMLIEKTQGRWEPIG